MLSIDAVVLPFRYTLAEPKKNIAKLKHVYTSYGPSNHRAYTDPIYLTRFHNAINMY